MDIGISSPHTPFRAHIGMRTMGKLSTHVLDTAQGKPGRRGGDRAVFRISGGARSLLVSAVTNADGRCDKPPAGRRALKVGQYELVFAAGDYFAAQGVALPEPALRRPGDDCRGSACADAGSYSELPCAAGRQALRPGPQVLDLVPGQSSWEHIINDQLLINSENIALCCVSCNASKGTKSLHTWLNSNYCVSRTITKESMGGIAIAALTKSSSHNQ
jgi:5-hydroxyisourate hydrolase-like protein (transthyretin family)